MYAYEEIYSFILRLIKPSFGRLARSENLQILIYVVSTRMVSFLGFPKGEFIDKVTRGTAQRCYMRDNDNNKTRPAAHLQEQERILPHATQREGKNGDRRLDSREGGRGTRVTGRQGYKLWYSLRRFAFLLGEVNRKKDTTKP